MFHEYAYGIYESEIDLREMKKSDGMENTLKLLT